MKCKCYSNGSLLQEDRPGYAKKPLEMRGAGACSFGRVCALTTSPFQVQYLDMPLVRATNSGAKTILAHFHYCYKGQKLFTEGFNWNSQKVRRMARLDPEQTSFMSQCRDYVVRKSE